MLSTFKKFFQTNRIDNTPSLIEHRVQSRLGIGEFHLEQMDDSKICVTFADVELDHAELSVLAEKIMGLFNGLFEYPVTVGVVDSKLLFSVDRSGHHQPMKQLFSPRSIEQQLKDLSNEKGEHLFQDSDFLRNTLQKHIAASRRANELVPLYLAKVAIYPAIELSHKCVAGVIGQLLKKGILTNFHIIRDREVIDEAIGKPICAVTENLAEFIETQGANDAASKVNPVGEKSSEDLNADMMQTSSDKAPDFNFTFVEAVLEEVWHALEDKQFIKSSFREDYDKLVEQTIGQLRKEIPG